MNLTDRVAVLEAAVTAWEERRRRLVPAELESDPSVQETIKDCLLSYSQKMKDFTNQRRIDAKTAEQNRLREEARYELELAEKRELARDLAAIEFYQEHGFAPAGYSIAEKTED